MQSFRGTRLVSAQFPWVIRRGLGLGEVDSPGAGVVICRRLANQSVLAHLELLMEEPWQSVDLDAAAVGYSSEQYTLSQEVYMSDQD